MMTSEQRDYALCYSDSWSKAWPLASDGISEARRRLIWFVGIAGYLLVNGKEFWPILLGQELGTTSFLVLASPSAIAAVCFLVAYRHVDKGATAQANFYFRKLVEINSAIGQGSFELFAKIDADHGPLAELKTEMNKTKTVVEDWLLRSEVTLGVAILWSLIGPVLIKGYLSLGK